MVLLKDVVDGTHHCTSSSIGFHFGYLHSVTKDVFPLLGPVITILTEDSLNDVKMVSLLKAASPTYFRGKK